VRLKLTDLSVRGLAPSAGQVKVWDTVTKGFGVRVNGASKSWFVMFGKSRKLKVLGHYPATSLADARRAAKEILLSPEERPIYLTFKDATAQFLATQDHLAARTISDYSRLLKVRFEPAFGHKRLNDIDTKAVSDVLDSLSATPGERKYAHSVIRRFFKWAVARRLVDHSPVEGMEAPKTPASRDRVLTDAEIKALWNATGDGKIFSNIVRLLLLTGQRRGEISQLQISWIKENEIVLPKEVTKNGREHTFPVGSLGASLLRAQLEKSTNGLLFPARNRQDEPLLGWSKLKAALDKKLGPDFAPWTLHDCRRTFATNMAKLGVRLEVTEKLLNHVSGSTGGIVGVYMKYNFESEMRSAIELWEAKLVSIVDCEAPRRTTPSF
jgi:integrase